MLKSFFGVPQAIHESVVREALESQRILMREANEKIDRLTRENQSLLQALDERTADLRRMGEDIARMAGVQAPRPVGVPRETPAQPGRPIRPAYGQANSHFRMSKPAAKEEAAKVAEVAQLIGKPA